MKSFCAMSANCSWPFGNRKVIRESAASSSPLNNEQPATTLTYDLSLRDIIRSRDQQRIMFVQMDDSAVEGTFSLDGAIDARQHSPDEIARMIKQRVDLLP